MRFPARCGFWITAVAVTAGMTLSVSPPAQAGPGISRPAAARGVAASNLSTAVPVAASKAVTPAACRSLGTSHLEVGSHGTAVSTLQTCLTQLGGAPLGSDGSFGDNTEHAVLAQQKLYGLDRDGVVGPQTRSHLALAIHVVMPASPDARQLTAFIDIDLQVMFFLNSTGVRVLDVSTGSERLYLNPLAGEEQVAHTPRGYFSIVRKIAGLHESSSGLGTMYYPSYFNWLGYAIHGSGSVPVSPESHGCVRVTRSLERIVYAALPIGSALYIR